MSKTKELFMRLREDQSQFEADIREQEHIHFLQTNKTKQNANRSDNNGFTRF